MGGLTVLRAIQERLPLESTIYVGDLQHFPYGPRYQEEVKQFAFEIIRHLQQAQVKLIVIACNTATAAALNQAREVFDVPLVGVISPGAQAAVQATRKGLVGVISTEGTRLSQEYLHAIKELDPMVGVYQQACPELVQLVEDGDAQSGRAKEALRRDLAPFVDLGADVLVLGCTHYPLLRPAIEAVYPGAFALVDSAETTAAMVERRLDHARMRALPGPGQPVHELRVTAVPRRFHEVGEILFGRPVPLVKVIRLDQSSSAQDATPGIMGGRDQATPHSGSSGGA